jgi:hypothetical protein
MLFFDRFKQKRSSEQGEEPTPHGNRFFTHVPTKLRSGTYNDTFKNFVTGYADTKLTENCPPVDLFHYGPDPDGRPYHTLVTNGMSDRPMNTPADHPTIPRRAEIVLYVKEPNDQHFLWIKWAAKFPFIDNTYLDHGHTIRWHEPLFAGSELSCILFIDSIVREDNALQKRLIIEGDPINLLWFVPITRAEWELKKEFGIGALLDVFDQHKHPIALDEQRPSYV